MWPRLRPGSFYGKTVRTFEANGLVLAESSYPPQFEAPKHAHEHAFCYLVLAGSCTESYGNRSRHIGPSHVVFHPAGATHSDRWHANGGTCLHVEFGSTWLERVRAYSPVLDQPAEFRAGAPASLAAKIYAELRHPDGVSALVIEGLTLELVARMTRAIAGAPGRRPPPWLRQAEEQLAANFRVPPTLTELGRAAGVHPVHLATVFRRYFRCTPGEYVRQLRIDFARDRLARTEAPLVEIALEAGFSHQSHFCRVFKRATGMTPSSYRQLFACTA
jgi:AraC family transcriptional regulator